MKFSDLSSSKYLAKTDVPAQGLNLTIAGFTLVQLDDGAKPAMAFLEANVKPMLVNKTNRNRLTSIFGTDDSQQMIGGRICVFNDASVEMGGELVGGLRIRPVALTAPAPSQTVYAPRRQAAPAAAPELSESSLAAALAILQARADAQKQPGPPADPFDQEVPF